MSETEVRIVNFAGALRWPLPEASVQSMSWKLNGAGTMSYEQMTTAQNADKAAMLHERDVEVQVWRDGELVWWGVPMADSGGPGQQVIGCDSLEIYLEDFVIADATMQWEATEQMEIVSDLIAYMQDESVQAHRNKNLGVSLTASGKLRYRRLERSEHPILSQVFAEFPGLKEGFDYGITYTPDGQRLFRAWYPQRGIVHTDFMLEYGKNITNYTWNRTAVGMRTEAYATGGAVPGSGGGANLKMEGHYENVDASEKYGVIQHVFSEGSQMDIDWLNDAAERDIEYNGQPKNGVTVSAVDIGDSELFGKVNPGDWVPVRIVDGYRQFEKNMRVGNVTWNSDETMAYDFIEETPEVYL